MGKHFKFQISLILITVMIFGICQSWNIEGTFAEEAKGPDVIVDITGEARTGGPLFSSSGNIGQGLWYPGKVPQKGILRIENNYSQKVKVKSFGLTMKLKDKNNNDVDNQELYELFAKTMKLTIEKGSIMRFIEAPIYESSFYEMLYEVGSLTYKGYILPESQTFEINRGEDIDLRYTVQMIDTGEPQNDLQGLTAAVKFLMNVQLPEHNDNNNDDDTDEEELVEEPIDEIPDANGHWAHDCIMTLLKHEIIQGYPDGSIKPDEFITRAEAAVLVGKALQLEEVDKFLSGYIDPVPEWSKGYIIATSQKDIFNGYPGMLFLPNKNITREEMIKVLVKAFEKKLEEDNELEFEDEEEISDWALEYAKIGVQQKVIEGYPDNTFKPDNSITRAEAFTIICKLLGYHNEHNSN